MTLEAIAIDGPAGSGKSTVARGVAERLGFLYVDTGAMYRAVALAALRAGVDLEASDAVGRVARDCRIDFDESGSRVFLNGDDVTDMIRTPDVTEKVRYAARSQETRQELVAHQQELAKGRPVVMEGRDITTVVLKNARWKFFLTATPEVRAERRLADFTGAGHVVDYETLLAEIKDRDESDNSVGPMKVAQEIAARGDGQIELLDTTEMSADDVIECIASHVRG